MIPAFKKSGIFCFNNWMDKKCMKLRDILIELTDNQNYNSKRFEIEYKWYADNTYFFITNKEDAFYYIVTWYKSRGETECILFQGRPIWEDEMDYLLERLRKEKNYVRKK